MTPTVNLSQPSTLFSNVNVREDLHCVCHTKFKTLEYSEREEEVE
jgi:hypothetical protein